MCEEKKIKFDLKEKEVYSKKAFLLEERSDEYDTVPCFFGNFLSLEFLGMEFDSFGNAASSQKHSSYGRESSTMARFL